MLESVSNDEAEGREDCINGESCIVLQILARLTRFLGSRAHRDEAESVGESSDIDIEPPRKKQRKERTKKTGLIITNLHSIYG